MTFLNERCKDSGTKMLHVRIGSRRAGVSEEMGRFDGDFVQNERADDAVDRDDAKLLKIFGAEFFGHRQQPFDVLAVWRIARVSRLGPVVVSPAAERLQRDNSNPIGGQQEMQLRRSERLTGNTATSGRRADR